MIDMEEIEEMTREIRRKDKEANSSVKDQLLLKEEKKCDEVLIDENELRLDGRRAGEHRNMFIQLGTVSEARGSCYIELGNTKVVVSVRGPKEIPNIQEYTEMCVLECLVEMAPFAASPGLSECNEKFLSESLRFALEPVLCRHEFPNLQITVSAFVLEDGGSLLSAITTGASLALVHARLPCISILTAVTASLYRGEVIVDPTKDEENYCLKRSAAQKEFGLITMAYIPSLEQITLYQQLGSSDVSVFKKTFDSLSEHNKKLHLLASQHLMKELKLSVKDLVNSNVANAKMEKLSIG